MPNDPHTLRLFKRSEERPSLTIVCCVDKRYIKQAAVTLPLWLEAAGEIANYPFIVFYCDDGANSIPYEDVKRVFSVLPEVRYVAWPKPEWAYASAYSSQRDDADLFLPRSLLGRYRILFEDRCRCVPCSPHEY